MKPDCEHTRGTFPKAGSFREGLGTHAACAHTLKLLVIGLDGATWEMIAPLMEQGQLPNLQRLVKEGSSGNLRSTIPPVTAPAWSSFMTGLNPGKHGIFQWRTYDPTSYTGLNERIVTAERLAGRTFWDILGQAGYRVGVITVPMTYPTWRVNGYLLAGYPCPDSKKNYTYPPQWGEALSHSYNFSADYYLHASEDEIWRKGLEMLERRTSLALELIAKEGVDVCVLVLGEIDRAQHDFFKYAAPRFPHYHSAKGERYREVIADHYRVADAQVGRLLASAAAETTVIVMSDHGAGPHPPYYLHTNVWLEEQGWLRRKAEGRVPWGRLLRQGLAAARRLLPFEERLRRLLPARWVHGARQFSLNIADVDWSRTRAYRLPMYHPAEGIEINLRGRQAEGIVAPGADYEALREEIIAALQAARDSRTGEPVVSAVYRREELYRGEYLAIAPDIVFITAADYAPGAGGAEAGSGRSSITPVPLAALHKYNGLHRLEGILMARGPHILAGKRVAQAEIIDLAPTILYALGEEIPTDIQYPRASDATAMDGTVLSELFAPTFLEAHPPRYGATRYEMGSRGEPCVRPLPLHLGSGPSEGESEDMRKKLKGLGYLAEG